MVFLSRVFRFSARCSVVGVVECIPRDYTHFRSEICAKQRYFHSRGFHCFTRVEVCGCDGCGCGILAIGQLYSNCLIARLPECLPVSEMWVEMWVIG
jgi:hypothetical protein